VDVGVCNGYYNGLSLYYGVKVSELNNKCDRGDCMTVEQARKIIIESDIKAAMLNMTDLMHESIKGLAKATDELMLDMLNANGIDGCYIPLIIDQLNAKGMTVVIKDLYSSDYPKTTEICLMQGDKQIDMRSIRFNINYV